MSHELSTGLIPEIAEKLASCSVLIQTSGFENNLARRLRIDVGYALGLANPMLISRCITQMERAIKRCANGSVRSDHPVAVSVMEATALIVDWDETLRIVPDIALDCAPDDRKWEVEQRVIELAEIAKAKAEAKEEDARIVADALAEGDSEVA